MQKVSKTAMVAGGVALASLGVLAYTLTRPTKAKKKRSTPKAKGPPKPKYTRTYRSKPLDIHFVMSSDEGFHAYVAADKKNKEKKNLKYGSQLLKINEQRVENWSHENTLKHLLNAKYPLTLVFREHSDLEQQWTESAQIKEKANEFYKEGKIKEGIEWQTKAIALHPTNKVYYSNRVLMYLKTKAYERALEDCQKIRELDPLSRYVKGHYLRGLVLFNMENYKYASSAFQTVVKMNPKFKLAEDRLKECQQWIEKEQKHLEEERRRNSIQLMESVMKKQQSQEDSKESEPLKSQANNPKPLGEGQAQAQAEAQEEDASVEKEDKEVKEVSQEQKETEEAPKQENVAPPEESKEIDSDQKEAENDKDVQPAPAQAEAQVEAQAEQTNDN